MQKIKMMISSFLVLAIVGGALAFLPKKENKYCIYATESNGSCIDKFCSDSLIDVKSGGFMYYCTTTVPAWGCRSTTGCKNASPVALTFE